MYIYIYLKKTKSDILQLNVTNSALTDKKEVDSDFRETDCSSEKNHLLKNACFGNITDNWKIRCQKNKT